MRIVERREKKIYETMNESNQKHKMRKRNNHSKNTKQFQPSRTDQVNTYVVIFGFEFD